MALDRAIAAGKEHRKPYRDSRRFDYTCRNHKACTYCQRNRLQQARRQSEQEHLEKQEAREEQEEWLKAI